MTFLVDLIQADSVVEIPNGFVALVDLVCQLIFLHVVVFLLLKYFCFQLLYSFKQLLLFALLDFSQLVQMVHLQLHDF
jgi:hypothetical protein